MEEKKYNCTYCIYYKEKAGFTNYCSWYKCKIDYPKDNVCDNFNYDLEKLHKI